MPDTRDKLIDAALETVRRNGIVGVSARAVASRAGVKPALVLYHFGGVGELLGEACLAETRARIERYRPRLAAVRSLRDLLDLGRTLHEEEHDLGGGVLAQLLAAVRGDATLAGPAQQALALWVAEIEAVLGRLLVETPLGELADPAGLARAVSAAFIGLELFDGVDPCGARAALLALDQLGAMVEVLEDLGPVARRALRAKLGRPTRPVTRTGAAAKDHQPSPTDPHN